MQVKIIASVQIPMSPEEVFDYVMDLNNLCKVFRGKGPIPAIEKMQVEGGGPLKVGAVRLTTMSDGSVLEEDILVYERGRCNRYRIERGFKPPLSLLVRWGEGEFLFTQNAGATQVVWNYTFELTTPLVYPLAALILKVFMRGALQEALDGTRDNMMAGEG
jgi:hypothetical protein